jgi:hypothetical protein
MVFIASYFSSRFFLSFLIYAQITEDPDRFVMEVVLGAFEKHPAR